MKIIFEICITRAQVAYYQSGDRESVRQHMKGQTYVCADQRGIASRKTLRRKLHGC